MTPRPLTFLVWTTGALATCCAPANALDDAATAITAASTARTAIRSFVLRVATAVPLYPQEGGAGAQERSRSTRLRPGRGLSVNRGRGNRRATEHRQALHADAARLQGLLRPSHRHLPDHRRLVEVAGEGDACQLLPGTEVREGPSGAVLRERARREGAADDLRLGAGRVGLQPPLGRGLGDVEAGRQAGPGRPGHPDRQAREAGQDDGAGRTHRPQRPDPQIRVKSCALHPDLKELRPRESAASRPRSVPEIAISGARSSVSTGANSAAVCPGPKKRSGGVSRRFEKLRRRVVCRQPRAGVEMIFSRFGTAGPPPFGGSAKSARLGRLLYAQYADAAGSGSFGRSESGGVQTGPFRTRRSASSAGIGRPKRYPWPRRQPSCRSRSACAGCSIPSPTVARPSESPSRRIASTNESSAPSPTSLSTNGFGIFSDSIGNSARRLSDE